MERLDVPQFLGLLVIMLGAAKLFGAMAQFIGQPAVLGELVAGVVLGQSVLGLVNPKGEVLHLLAELGVVILLFEIGLETDLRKLLQVGGAAAVVGKFLAGYAPFWFKGNKKVIGVGMIPRGEVGLIFAQMGLTSGVFDAGQFSAVTLMVMVTTFMAPPLLKLLFPPVHRNEEPPEPEGIEELVT